MRTRTAGTTDRVLITVFFCVESFSRNLLMAIVPLDLFAQLGSTQRVTLFYAVVSVFGLGNSILVPLLLHRVGLRLTVAAAGVFVALAAVLLGSGNLIGIGLGLAARIVGTACIEIPMMAFMMDRIPRGEIGAFEPKRIFFQGSCMAIAPWLGFFLHEQVSHGAPFLISAIGGMIILGAAFVTLPTAVHNKTAPVIRRPTATVKRFFEQPRLRLAWALAFIRSSFWVIFSIYAPIFTVTCGWTPTAAAAVLSFGNASMFLVFFWGALARRVGARPVLMTGFGIGATFLLLTAVAGVWWPSVAPVFFFAAACGAAIIDGAGNIPFLRATRASERPNMAGIYTTYRDTSQFVPIAAFSLILLVSQLSAAFAIFAGVMFGAARLSLFIHPRLR